MKNKFVIFVIGLLIFFFPVANGQALDDFRSLLDNCWMIFEVPDGFKEGKIINNNDMNYEYALAYPDKDFEVRYSVRPIRQQHYENDSLKTQMENMATFRNTQYKTVLQAIIFNISGDFNFKFGPFDEEAVKDEFNADWGGMTLVELKKEGFGEGFKYCMVVAIHKDDVADAYYYYMANSKNRLMDNVMPLFHSLRFK